MVNEHELTRGNNPLLGDNDRFWQARDEQASEVEVEEFLHSLIRLVKPEIIVETGCYLGDGTLAMASALVANNLPMSRIYSCDIDPVRVKVTTEKIKPLYNGDGNFDYAIFAGKGIDLIKNIGALVDFAFIDSGGEKNVRREEVEELLKYLRPGKLFAIHDTAPQHQGCHALVDAIALPKIYFNCPRGLTLFQKI